MLRKEVEYMEKKILVTRTSLPEYDTFTEKIKPLWESRWITNMGIYHKELEKALKEFMDVSNVSLMVNGHMALELVIQAMNFPEGSEVITTPFTFVSTTHAIIRNRLKPVFCDIKMSDYTIDEDKIEALITERTVAIVPVHVYGNICNVEKINEIAKKHNLKVIYDAAHTFGEKYKGLSVGKFGDASIFSFHATKVFNTIEGGAVTSESRDLFERLYNLKNFGIRGEEHIVGVGSNAKMNEFAAIMGLCNLENLSDAIEARKKIVEYYSKQLAEVDNIRLPLFDNNDIEYNYAYYPVLFKKENMRNIVYQKLRENNIFARKYFYPLTSEAECFGGEFKRFKLENAHKAAENILVLPLYPELELDDVNRICNIIKECDIMD